MASDFPGDGSAQSSFEETEGWDSGEGYGTAAGNTQPHISEHSHPGQQAYSIDAEIVVPGDTADSASASDGEGGDEYDPESVATYEPQIIPSPAPAPANMSETKPKMSKMASGFAIDSSDDEEDDEDIDVSASTSGSGTGSREGSGEGSAEGPGMEMNSNVAAESAPSGVLPQPQPDSPVPESSRPADEDDASIDQPEVLMVVDPPAALAGTVPSGVPDPVAQPQMPSSIPPPTFQPDMIAVMEKRVETDPRGDMDAWLALMKEHRERNRFAELRDVYSRFLEMFPHAADIWVENLNMELSMDNFSGAEDIFRRCLMTVPSVRLWTTYLDYIRRRHDLNDPSGDARRTIAQSYEFVLDNIGIDKDAGPLWQDYIHFVRNGPGQLGGTSWQDQQKMDQLRKAYQRAICIPISTLGSLWKEYDQFEMTLNKVTARKFLQEKSPAYMTARSANTSLENTIRGLVRSTVPRLPPAPGFDGDQEFQEQVDRWTRWIAWEKDDFLGFRSDDAKTYQQRVLHVYRQALMALRFWPETWVDAAEWCFDNEIVKDGKDVGLEFLHEGIKANPESVLLALKLADRIESTHPVEEGDEAKIARGKAVREPYDKVLNTLYDMIDALKKRENSEVERIKNSDGGGMFPLPLPPPPVLDDEDEDDERSATDKAKEGAKQEGIKLVHKGFAIQTDLLKKTVTFVWIALFRAMRRLQGKGSTKAGASFPGARGLFQEARGRGRLTSEIYAAVAQVEWNVYRDPSATKIFDRGAKLFPEDELYLIEYLKHMHAQHDTTNARVVFETCVNKFTQNPNLIHKAKPLYAYFHKYESYFGELSQISKLEKRMAELFPEDPKLKHFSARFSAGDGFGLGEFSPVGARLVVSPAAQMRPKMGLIPSIEAPPPMSVRSVSRSVSRGEGIGNSPRPPFAQPAATNSPKRALVVDDDEAGGRPRKIPRGESPLKGAAGRRMDQQRRHGGDRFNREDRGVQLGGQVARDIGFLLGQIPGRDVYRGPGYQVGGVVGLIRDVYVPTFGEWRSGGGQQQGGREQRHLPSHSRQPSGQDYSQSYQQYGGSRNSPAPGRPISPYDAAGRRGPQPPVTAGPAGYRHSPLNRPGSSGGYEQSGYPPPPAQGYETQQGGWATAGGYGGQGQQQQQRGGYY